MASTPSKAELRALPKKQRRVVARELARQQKIADQKRARRRRIVLRITAGAVAGGLAAAGVLGAKAWVDSRNRGPLNMASDGIELSSYQSVVVATPTPALSVGEAPVPTISYRDYGMLDAVLYVDYSSPDTAPLWSTASGDLTSELTGGAATLEIHPIAPDGSDSAVRAAAAMGCVAEFAPDSALTAHEALVAGGTDWTASSLADAMTGASIDDPDVAACITSGRFTGWATDATKRAATSVPFDIGSVTGTTLLLAGEPYDGADDADAFAAALQSAQAVVDEAYAAAHGGLWRAAYAPRSALGLAALLGIGGANG